jgi:hypothetical protein
MYKIILWCRKIKQKVSIYSKRRTNLNLEDLREEKEQENKTRNG